LFIHPADGLHGGLGAVSSQDVLIAISKGGKSDEINEFVSRAKSRGLSVIVFTASENSALAKLADVCLVIKTLPGSDPGERFPMGSTLAVSAVGDALALVLMGLKDYSWENFIFTHPGGAVGKNNLDQSQDL
jgi:arabinose-5-phosphate isomerase